MLGVVICQEARQCVERCKPGVAGSNAIAALFLDEGQEFGSGLGGEIVEVKLFNGPSGMLGDIAQEENDGVAIAADGWCADSGHAMSASSPGRIGQGPCPSS